MGNVDCGVYSIKDKDGREYIGSSIHIKRRWAAHKSALRRNTHRNYLLQNAFNSYSEDFFEFKTLLICESSDLLFYEQLLLDAFKPFYNICIYAASPGKGRKASDETKAKMSLTRKGRKHSQETRDKISASHKGKTISEAHRESISKTLTGRPGRKLSAEAKLRISQANKGRKRPDLSQRNRARGGSYG